MGILDFQNKKKDLLTNTKGLYFGAPEAEAENVNGYKLTDYFDDYLDILNNLELGKFIFVGRKGVGKSAITKFIKDKSDVSKNSFATIQRISDFEIERQIQKSAEEFDKDMLLFEWLILINIVKLVVKNECGTYTQEYTKLKKFLESNSGIVAIDKFQIDEAFKKSGGEINFGVLTHSFGGVFKKYFDVKVTKAPFYKLIPPLKEIVKIILDYSVNKETEFWLLFDDLDVNFNVFSESDKLKVWELVRLAKSYNNEIFINNKAKILIFMREDIRSELITKFPDSAKVFNSYEIIINWYNYLGSNTEENDIALKKMINKRIELGFKNKGLKLNNENDAWYTLFCDDNFNMGSGSKKTSFKYILDFTFYRPRDLITLLNIISDDGYNFPINSYEIKRIIEKYITKNIYEIKSELSLYFSEKEKEIIFNDLFRYVMDYPIKSYDKVKEKIKSLNFNCDDEIVINILISYSLLIPQNSDGELYFNYREKNDLDKIKKDELNISLPKCIYNYYKKIY